MHAIPGARSRASRSVRLQPLAPGLALALLALAACGSGPTDPESGLDGGVLAEFEVSGERFRIWMTDDEAIARLLALRDGQSQASIPIGPVRPGPGQADHNLPWSWHIDPEEVAMADATIELCDGRPSFVEEDVAAWIETVGSFCPWGAALVSVEGHR